jgi:FkbM family methyltransferase
MITTSHNQIKKILSSLSKNDSELLTSILLDELPRTKCIETPIGNLIFSIQGDYSLSRADDLFEGEPEIFDWINTFQETDIIWDIGANVGAYSMYIAKKGHKVFSFEPASSNFYLLQKHIHINKLHNNLKAYCLALTDSTQLNNLYQEVYKTASGNNTFGSNTDWLGNVFSPKNIESTVGFSIDDFIEFFNLPIPNHIKIDVDGAEDKVIFGAIKTLQNKTLKSIYIELTDRREDYNKKIFNVLLQSGFQLFSKAHASRYDNSNFSDMYNYVFIKV